MRKDEFTSLFKASSYLRKCFASRSCETVISSSNHNIVKYRVFPQIRLHRWSRTIVQLANPPQLVFMNKYHRYKYTIINQVLYYLFEHTCRLPKKKPPQVFATDIFSLGFPIPLYYLRMARFGLHQELQETILTAIK